MMRRVKVGRWRTGAAGAASVLAAAVLAAVVHAGPSTRAMDQAMAAMARTGETPVVGQKALDFTLTSLDGVRVSLAAAVARRPVVLVVLRGFPTYQCPFCTRQFGDYLSNAAVLEATGAAVLFVYPGPPEGLAGHARALVAGRPLPPSYQVLMDPDYSFTRAYNLRWDAPQETAYPSTFVIDKGGVVRFAKTSREHGDRVTVAEVVTALSALR